VGQVQHLAIVQMRHLMATAPDQLNQRLKDPSVRALVDGRHHCVALVQPIR
jgi:hypothetical protein